MKATNIFLEQIVPEALTGKIKIDDIYYNIKFNTIIFNDKKEKRYYKENSESLPTLVIKNLKNFSLCLEKYLNIYKSKYFNMYKYLELNNELDKFILSMLFINATEEDFNNPEIFINKRINFLKNNTLEKYSNKEIYFSDDSILKGNKIIIVNHLEKLNNETPYSLKMYIENIDTGYVFPLPKISYGIDKDKLLYVYAIQSDNEILTKFNDNKTYKNIINRLLYKVNENFIDEGVLGNYIDDIHNPENMSSVVPSFLISLTVLYALLEKEEINLIRVVDYLPIRWNAKESSTIDEFNYLKKHNSNLDKDKFFDERNIKNEHIQRNLTDKLFRTFRRMEFNFSNINIDSYPKEIGSFSQFKINFNTNNTAKSTLLRQVYEATLNQSTNKKKR